MDNKAITGTTEKNNLTGCILLDDKKDFLITRVGETYSNSMHVTCRSPRKIGKTIVSLIITTTIRASDLNMLRVEEIDGQIFIVNEKVSHHDPIRFTVMSKKIGFDIIKAIINEYKIDAPKESARNSRIVKTKELGDMLIPYLTAFAFCILAVAASTWLFSHA